MNLLFLQGKQWIFDVMVCLMKDINESIVYRELLTSNSCNELQHMALQSHSNCYIDNGFCSVILQWTNMKEFLSILQFADLISWNSLQPVIFSVFFMKLQAHHTPAGLADRVWLPARNYQRNFLEVVISMLEVTISLKINSPSSLDTHWHIHLPWSFIRRNSCAMEWGHTLFALCSSKIHYWCGCFQLVEESWARQVGWAEVIRSPSLHLVLQWFFKLSLSLRFIMMCTVE